MSNELSAIHLDDCSIKADVDGHFSLTDIWCAHGSVYGKRPNNFLALKSTKEFAEKLSDEAGISALWKTKKGKGLSGTWAHIKIALAYSEWINPEFHSRVLDAFLEWLEEEKNPNLKISRGVERLIAKGKSLSWAGTRIDGVKTHRSLTDELDAHGCDQSGNVWKGGYFRISNLLNEAVLGMSTQKFKNAHGIKGNRSARDLMTERQLRKLAHLEEEIRYEIIEKNPQGNDECVAVAETYLFPQRALNAAG